MTFNGTPVGVLFVSVTGPPFLGPEEGGFFGVVLGVIGPSSSFLVVFLDVFGVFGVFGSLGLEVLFGADFFGVFVGSFLGVFGL